MTQTALYRHYDAAGRLLYVGISTDPFRRLKQHKNGADWSRRVATIKVEWHGSRQAAALAEAVAIKAELPKHNVKLMVQRTKRGRDQASARLDRRVASADAFLALKRRAAERYRAQAERKATRTAEAAR